MKILIAGDVHSRFERLWYLQKETQKQFPDCTTCIQVGDYGFYPASMPSLPVYPMTTFVIDGNHEDHRWLRHNFEIMKDDWSTHNLYFMDRGTVMTLGDSTIGFIGGAMNVDRPNFADEDLCYNNYISAADVDKTLKEFNKYTLDLVVSHSCPTGIGVNMKGHPYFVPLVKLFVTDQFNLPAMPTNDCGEHALTEVWNGLTTKPKCWMYGHFHATHCKYVKDTLFTCVGSSDQTTDAEHLIPYIYDTETKTIKEGERIPHYTTSQM